MDQEINNNQGDHQIHSRHWFGFILVLMLSIVLACGVVYYLMNQQFKDEKGNLVAQIESERQAKEMCKLETQQEIANLQNQIDENKTQNKSGLTSSDTSTWKTYKNENLGYEIKYPDNFTANRYNLIISDYEGAYNTTEGVKACELEKSDNGDTVIFWNNGFLENRTGDFLISNFQVNVNDPDDECISGHYTPSSFGIKTFELSKSENVMINKESVLKRTYKDIPQREGETQLEFITWRFNKKGTYYTIRYEDGSLGLSEKVDEKNKILEEIINSFKFIK